MQSEGGEKKGKVLWLHATLRLNGQDMWSHYQVQDRETKEQHLYENKGRKEK
jgi:hypothetical protein